MGLEWVTHPGGGMESRRHRVDCLHVRVGLSPVGRRRPADGFGPGVGQAFQPDAEDSSGWKARLTSLSASDRPLSVARGSLPRIARARGPHGADVVSGPDRPGTRQRTPKTGPRTDAGGRRPGRARTPSAPAGVDQMVGPMPTPAATYSRLLPARQHFVPARCRPVRVRAMRVGRSAGRGAKGGARRFAKSVTSPYPVLRPLTPARAGQAGKLKGTWTARPRPGTTIVMDLQPRGQLESRILQGISRRPLTESSTGTAAAPCCSCRTRTTP